MPRWKGNGRHSTEGTKWKHEYCVFCGLRYTDLRVKDYMGVDNLWEHCKKEQELEVAPREESGDYSKPVNRRSVLGRMFEYKQESWNKHLEDCEQDALGQALEEGVVENEEAFYRLIESLDVTFAEFMKDWCPF